MVSGVTEQRCVYIVTNWRFVFRREPLSFFSLKRSTMRDQAARAENEFVHRTIEFSNICAENGMRRLI